MSPSRPRRIVGLTVAAAVVAALFAVAFLVPLPFTVMVPGTAADTLGTVKGKPVIAVSGVPTRSSTSGTLRMTTIGATLPNAKVTLADGIRAWFDTAQAVVPREAVYPSGKSSAQLDALNAKEMRSSQENATAAARGYLGPKGKDLQVSVNMPDVGGPSAGLMFTLGIIDKVEGDGHGGDLTGGHDIAGTGTISKSGAVGPVGGVTLKTKAARERGATVFLVPKQECAAAKGDAPQGLKLVPVTTLRGATSALAAVRSGGTLPHC